MIAATGFRTIRQSIHALVHEAPPNPRHRFRRQVKPRRDLRAAHASRAEENDTRAADHARRGRGACDESFQHLLLLTSRPNSVRVCHDHGLDHTLDAISTAVH
jgi:hypothetical protein